MPSITSNDGTPIAFQRSGTGPPLVLVHGTSASSSRWIHLLPDLEPLFSIYSLDRRGRGGSGDSESYAIEREFEDIAALAASIEEPIYLLGHSYGAICALEAALRIETLRRLILYEPPISLEGESSNPAGIIERLEANLEVGDREAVVSTFFREVVRMPPDEFELFRSLPTWPLRLAAAHTLPRELRAQDQYLFQAERFAELETPTMLLIGSESPALFRSTLETVNAALPNSRIVVLPGQQHIAMDTAPELFVREVVAFLEEPS
jgi:pimeloyl-ACP methyl ester carboxylesterase